MPPSAPAWRLRGAGVLACAAALLGTLTLGAAPAWAQSAGAEVRPEPVPDPDADPHAKKPLPRAQKVELKRTGKVVYKCGEEYTDQPVCQDHSRATRLKLSAEDEKRCDDFRKNNFTPWYCRK